MNLIVGANLVEKNDKFLLVQEKLGKSKGKWNFPAGRLEENEDIITRAIKEGKEETGLELEPKYLIGVYQYLVGDKNVIIFVFESEIIGGKIEIPENEIMDVKWFSIEEIRKLNKNNLLRGSYILDAIQRYVKNEKYPIGFIKIF